MVFGKVVGGMVETHFDAPEVAVLLDMAGERSRRDLIEGQTPCFLDETLLSGPSGEDAEKMYLSLDLLAHMRHGMYNYAAWTAREVQRIEWVEKSLAFTQLARQRQALGYRAVGMAAQFEDGVVRYGGVVIVGQFIQLLGGHPEHREAA